MNSAWKAASTSRRWSFTGCSSEFPAGFAWRCDPGIRRAPEADPPTIDTSPRKGTPMRADGLAVAELGAAGPPGATPPLGAVTNTMLAAACVTAVLILAAALVRLSLDLWPSRVQSAAGMLVESSLKVAEAAGGPRARRFVPLVGTAF